MLRRNLVFVSVLVITLILSGCQLFVKPTLDRIVVSADAETIKQGESVELEVKGFDKKNKEMKVSKPAWSAEPDNLGELDVNGAKAVFTAGETAEGKVTITVTSGDLSDSIEITIIKETTSVDKSDLEDAIQAATQLKQSTEVGTEPGQAPQEAHDALQAAIDAAQVVLDDENATQAEVDSATQALLQAIAEFEAAIVPDEEPGPVDTSDLENAIQIATHLIQSTEVGTEPDQAPQEAHDALQDAIDAAQAVLENEAAAQAEVDSAVQALQQAIAAFQDAIVPDEDPEETMLFRETFDNVPNGSSIRDTSVRSYLDNPGAIVDISGTMNVYDGVLEMSSQRFALRIPGLENAASPVLRITVKNDNGSGGTVANLELAVGSQYSSGGTEFTAHGTYPITDNQFQVLEIALNKDYTHTGILNFRGIVNKSGTAGLYVDTIEVVDAGSHQPGEPGDPDDPGHSDPTDPPPDIPTEPPETIDDAYFGLVGWAAMNGGTTGGAGCPEDKILFIDNGRDLYDALYANERRHKGDEKYGDPYPLIIYITGKITPDNTGEKKIDIKDQKDVTIIGYGDQGEFDGIGITIRRASNIIIRNLTIHHVNTGEKKSIDITEDSHHIWIDRCTFYSDLSHGKDYYDGLVDIKERAQYVTVSWCKFYNHYKTSLVGHNTDQSKAPDKVTYHHNYFYNVNSRTPLIRFATVHLFNNYFHNIVESGINVREGGKARIENNYFENVGSGNPNPKTGMIEGPIGWWYDDTKGDWEVIGNIFVDCPVSEYESTTTVHIPYDYGMALNDAERAKELVLMYAGAGSPSLEQ